MIRERQAENKNVVLGLATGSTPVPFYRELIRLHKEDGRTFSNVHTFNLDEYYGLTRDHPESYFRFMHDQLFDHVDIPADQIHIPNGTVALEEVYDFCLDYERKIEEAGGLDLQILGIGRTGHIGFNEPGSAADSITRMITLDRVTRQDAAADFLGVANVPRSAITMGVGTILNARRIVLMAWGSNKAEIVREAVEGEMTDRISASFIQSHDNAVFLIDKAASSHLTRFRYPWLVGPVEWGEDMMSRAVVWLSNKMAKPIFEIGGRGLQRGWCWRTTRLDFRGGVSGQHRRLQSRSEYHFWMARWKAGRRRLAPTGTIHAASEACPGIKPRAGRCIHRDGRYPGSPQGTRPQGDACFPNVRKPSRR